MNYQESILEPNGPSGLSVNATSKSYLKQIANWSTYFAILGFIFAGFMIIGAVAIMFIGGAANNSFSEAPFAGAGFMFGAGMGVLYILFSLLYIFPSYYMLQSANSLKKGIDSSNTEELEKGFLNLKSAFKFWGVLSIILISIYIVIFIGAALF